MANPFETQQTPATIQERWELNEALNFKKTPEETDASIKAYFAEKAAKAAKRGGQK
jgi:hypothetical protein